MTDVLDLIKRLEEATGPDRELDDAIAKAVLGWRLWRSKHGYWNIEGPNGERKTTINDPFGPLFDPETGKKNPDYDKEPTSWVWDCDIPCFTESVDAAMSLVPEDSEWFVQKYSDGRYEAGITHTRAERYDWSKNPGFTQQNSACAKTAALALTTASLKARATLRENARG